MSNKSTPEGVTQLGSGPGSTGPTREPATSSLTGVTFLTVAEVAALMRVSKMSVYRLIHAGELEAVRFGRSFRVPETAVNAYLRDAFYETG